MPPNPRSNAFRPYLTLEHTTPIPHPQVETNMDPDELFRRLLNAQVRDLLAWRPKEVTHASVTAVHPETGEAWTAYGKRERPGDLSVWVRQGGGVEPEKAERNLDLVARERDLPADRAL
jgi:hypothetical protein